MLKAAILGFGTVGSGTLEVLERNADTIARNAGEAIEVKYILDLRDFPNEPHQERFVKDFAVIENDPEVSIVIETMGGKGAAYTFTKRSLEAGKNVVTSNKELVATHGAELLEIAAQKNVNYLFEASVGGGIPIIRPMQRCLTANHLTQITGILNGTTNYILSKMSDEGVDYQTCLKEAQKLGYAEANPTADVEGFDSTYKNCILSSLAYKKRVPIDKIYREGISNISVEDIAIGKELGYAIKLLAISNVTDGKIEARVHPAFLPQTHPLSSVKGSFNALYIHGDSVDDVMLYGRGAGAFPTGSAIVSDIVFAAGKDVHRRYDFMCAEDVNDDDFATDFTSKYYVRTIVSGADALANVSKAFAQNNISIQSVLQKEGENGTAQIVFVTAQTKESAIKNTLSIVENLACVEKIAAVIRVEE